MWSETTGPGGFPEGSRIGNYTILRPLGAGGMAVVLLCEKAGIGGFKKKYVAKMIHPRLSEDEQFVKMFLDEARMCATLSHPNIVQVFEVDEAAGLPFLVMEHVDGPSLSKLVREAERKGPIHYGRVARILAGVCRGLHYAHTLSGETGPIIHRDVSLQNILVTGDGTAKLIDFGIAKAEGRLHETQAGTLKGKLQYMAPEQLRNQGPLTAASDVFAVGVCLYRATTGRHPFEASDEGGLIAQRISGQFPAPSTVKAGYPADLEAIVLAALRDDPAERTSTAAELAGALEWFSSHEPWASDQQDIGRWIAEQFPGGGEQFSKLSASELQTSSELLSRITGPSASMPRQPAAAPAPADRRWQLLAAGALGLVLLMGLALATVWVTTRPSAPPPPEQHVASDDQAAAAYLAEAEDALGKKDYRLATQLLTRCSSMTLTDPQLTIRLEKLTSRAQREIGLGMAQRLLAMGQPDDALASVRQLLDQDPTDPDALALLDQILAARAAAAPPEPEPEEHASGPSHASVVPGSLHVTGPEGATLFVDDASAGVLPIDGRPLRPGRHVLHVRKQGFESVERTVDVSSGEQVAWDVTLAEAKPAAAVPSELAAALAAAEPVEVLPDQGIEARPAPVAAPAPGPAPSPAAAPAPTPEEAPAAKVVHYSELTIRIAPKPIYPDSARGQQTDDLTCLAKVSVDAGGRVTDVSVSNCPPDFQESTRAAMARSRFAPYEVDGQAIPVVTTFPVKFSAHR